MSFPRSIDQLWVFGSHARGDPDERSDVDILMVSGSDETRYVRNYYSAKYAGKVDVAHYTYDGLLQLINGGSLFAWHLRNEAKPLYQRSNKLIELLNDMPRYSSHKADLRVLEALLRDVKLSLKNSRNTFIFDAGVLGTVVRNTAIIMNDYLGNDDYSPRAPFKLGTIKRALTMPLSALEYGFFQECRRSGERGDAVEVRVIGKTRLSELVDAICGWQHECVNYIEYNEATQ